MNDNSQKRTILIPVFSVKVGGIRTSNIKDIGRYAEIVPHSGRPLPRIGTTATFFGIDGKRIRGRVDSNVITANGTLIVDTFAQE